jgi:hypothetical protein
MMRATEATDPALPPADVKGSLLKGGRSVPPFNARADTSTPSLCTREVPQPETFSRSVPNAR